LVLDSAVKRVSLDATLAPQFRSQMEGRRGLFIKILSNTDQLVGWPLVILIAVFYFVGLALKQILHRLTLTFLGFSFLLCLFIGGLGNLSDGLHQETNFTGISGPYWIGPLLIWILFLLITLAIAAGLYFCAAAGLSLAIKDPERRTIDFELLFNGKLLTKPVLTSLLAGLLGGGVLSAIPYLAAVATIFLKPELNAADFEDLLVARAPALTSFAGSGPYFIFAVFMFAGSLVGAFVKRRGLARALFFIITFLALAGTDLVYVSSAGLILTALASTLLLTDLYHRYGVLAVTAASMASEAAVNSAALCAQSSFSLQQSGWSIRIGLVALIAAGLAGLRKAREVRPEEIAIPPGMFPTRPERERLKAEFEVARRAQQQMLPEAPPTIEGLDLAAVCQPSREVGGDLYDFITLPEGRLAIVVADVSGKGVPASLYMTLTKGLLDSVLEDVTDPGEVLREVNRHLYEVCRRKVFVTLFLGIIDPARRTLVYARAGHNPTVYCRASDRLTQLLKSPGMGLGLNNGKIFNSSLKVATLQLEPDDTLLFYSDGITEAMNGKREEYGEERLMKLAAGIDGLPAAQVCNFVMADVEKFLGSVQPQDDQTLVVVRIK
ncbi:MAG TPA: PP2C family protein-serine/threonine phosphatase, partial [Blastocatellia bacterium]|nr:PP2C family protein-serine/threonine phosphatase [Blastocatellia bacterium]